MHLVLPYLLILCSCVYSILSTQSRFIRTIYDNVTLITDSKLKGAKYLDNVQLELDVVEDPSQVVPYSVVKFTNRKVALKLMENKRWVRFNSNENAKGLHLRVKSLVIKTKPSKVLKDWILARVIPFPSIDEDSDRVIFSGATREISLRGYGIGSVHSMTFDPALKFHVEYDYSEVDSSSVVLRLRQGHQWRETPGPLRLMSIDTGGGEVVLNGGRGVKLGEVVMKSADPLPVTVFECSVLERSINTAIIEQKCQRNVSLPRIYSANSSVLIPGAGFNTKHTEFRFANNVCNVNVFVNVLSENYVQLKVNSLRCCLIVWPCTLSLTAVNTGYDWMDVGEIGVGVPIAKVFERPNVLASEDQLLRITESKVLLIKGSGFPLPHTGIVPQIYLGHRFMTGTYQDRSVSVRVFDAVKVISPTVIMVYLTDSCAWAAYKGPLVLGGINTMGCEKGESCLPNVHNTVQPGDGVWITDELSGMRFFSEGQIVASVVADATPHRPVTSVTVQSMISKSGIEIFDTSIEIRLTGCGFTHLRADDVMLTLGSKYNRLAEGVDYNITKDEVKMEFVLVLVPGKLWVRAPKHHADDTVDLVLSAFFAKHQDPTKNLLSLPVTARVSISPVVVENTTIVAWDEELLYVTYHPGSLRLSNGLPKFNLQKLSGSRNQLSDLRFKTIAVRLMSAVDQLYQATLQLDTAAQGRWSYRSGPLTIRSVSDGAVTYHFHPPHQKIVVANIVRPA